MLVFRAYIVAAADLLPPVLLHIHTAIRLFLLLGKDLMAIEFDEGKIMFEINNICK